MREGESERCALVTVGVAQYDDPARDAPRVGAAGGALVELFAGPDGGPLDNVPVSLCVLPRADEVDVRSALRAWGAAKAEVGVLIWSGHCERDFTGFPRLLLSDHPVAADTLADWISGPTFGDGSSS
ncbi:MAG: hypothetical protein ACRD1D_01250 [Acidimicrobiales bacterium]